MNQHWYYRQHRAALLAEGADALSWLQGMVSNDVRLLSRQGEALQACLLDNTGHIQTDALIVRTEKGALLDLHASTAADVTASLESFLILEECALILLTGWTSIGLTYNSSLPPELLPHGAIAIPAFELGCPGYVVWLESSRLATTISALRKLDFTELSEDEAERTRIAAGVPRFGMDFDTRSLPAEANLTDTHISFSKGCYIGQEIVARMQARGHANRTLVRLISKQQLPVSAPLYLLNSSRETGRITSSAASVAGGCAIASVRMEAGEAGTELCLVPNSSAVAATAAGPALPVAVTIR